MEWNGAVDLLLVDRVTATGEDARSPGQGVAHAYPQGSTVLPPNQHPSTPGGISPPTPRGGDARSPSANTEAAAHTVFGD